MKALYRGIMSGKVAGACLDVFEQEPLSAMGDEMKQLFDELVLLPNFIVTPHIAGYTDEALYKMSKTLAQKIKNHILNDLK